MTKRIKIKSSTKRVVLPASTKYETVGVKDVARAVGGEIMNAAIRAAPAQYAELRRQLAAVIKSRGGRPGLEGTEHRPRIPMTDHDWKVLEQIARALATEGFSPTPSQIASQLLHDELERLHSQSEAAPPVTHAREPQAPYRARKPGWKEGRRLHLLQSEDAMEKKAA